MPPSRSKYKRVTDLYVRGTELVLEDGSVMYCRVLNPFELEEARHDAQTARSRLILALKKNGSDELNKVEAQFSVDGRDTAIQRLLDAHSAEVLVKAVESIKNDPDWVEKLDIMDRSDDLISRPQEDIERQLLVEINDEYIAHIQSFTQDELDFLKGKFEAMADEDLIKEYVELYIEHRGTEVAMSEHRVTEIWYGARCCEGVQGEDGTWDHSECNGHRLSVFEKKEEVRDLPDDLLSVLSDTFDGLSMAARDARFSDRQGSSSESSPLPSDAGDSKPSTQTATLVSAPGT